MKIPAFPIFQGVELLSKDVIDDFLSRHPLEASEYTFTNMFAFRTTYNFRISRMEDNLILLRDSEPVSIFCPIGGSMIPEALHELFDYLRKRNEDPCLERVPESFIRSNVKEVDDFIFEEERDQFDYVYNVKELIELKGNRFHDKKNHVNNFRKHYAYSYQSLTPDLIGECLAFEDYWCRIKECGKVPGLHKERCAILEMLNNFGSLHIRGGIIRIDNRVAALALGEKMLQDTFVIHVEKANPDIPGLYQVINQEFLMHEARDCTFVNREQDLGIPGMRKAKLSYNPVKFIMKYRVKIRS
jgi:hypothetical protein